MAVEAAVAVEAEEGEGEEEWDATEDSAREQPDADADNETGWWEGNKIMGWRWRIEQLMQQNDFGTLFL